MTTLVAVVFPHESTASAAAEDVQWLALDVSVDADAVAVVTRDRAGGFHMTTNHGVTGGTQWGVFWVLLLEALFRSQCDVHAGPGRGRSPSRGYHAVDDTFRGHLQDMLTPGCSALLLAAEDVLSEEAVRELTRLGGVLVMWGLAADARMLIQGALSGVTATSGSGQLWPADDRHEASPGGTRLGTGLLLLPGQACGSV
jgi:uncharacterized membrane protein